MTSFNTISFASQLASARLKMRQGAALLDSFAVIAFAASTWLTLTTLGGLWMFYKRSPHVKEYLAQATGDPSFLIDDANQFGLTYVFLSILAVALLIVPLLSLGMAAARLGAQGRTKRLASLRLVGMSAGHIIRISLVETMVQYVIGYAIGFVLYVSTLPAWSMLSFQEKKIAMAEMLLPWWALIAVVAALGALAALATLIGLLRVSISPLGVARRFSPQSLKMWRFAFLAVSIVSAIVIMTQIGPSTLDSVHEQILALVAVVILVVAGVSVAGPLFIQLTARVGLLTSNGAKLLAARRVIDDPRATWRNLSAIAFIGLITALVTSGGYINIEVSDAASVPEETFVTIFKHDIVLGILIVFALTLILGAVSTLIHQASDVFDRAPEQRALVNMGVSLRVFSMARIRQVMWPFIVSTLFAVTLGCIPGITFTLLNNKPLSDEFIWLVWMVGAGTLITAAAMALTLPIERRVLLTQARKND